MFKEFVFIIKDNNKTRDMFVVLFSSCEYNLVIYYIFLFYSITFFFDDC